MPKNIERLSQDSQTIAQQLEDLKKLTSRERESKQVELQSQIEQMSTELQNHLTALETKTDEESSNERTKTEELLSSMQTYNNELLTLGGDIQGQSTSQLDKDVEELDKSRLRKQRDKSTDLDERKENPIQNVARVAAGIGATALAVKGAKKLRGGMKKLFGFGSEKDESDKNTNKKASTKEENESRSVRAMKRVGVAGGTALGVFGGIKVRKILKEKFPNFFGTELNFEDSFIKVAADLQRVSEKGMNIGANLSYKEIGDGKVLLSSYGEDIELDTKAKKIPGMDISFSTFDQLIHAANLANFTKGAFRGRCESNTPFTTSKLGGGDLEVNLLEGGSQEFMSGAGLPMGKIIAGLTAAGLLYGTPTSKVIGIKGSFITLLGAIALGDYLGDNNSTLQNICKPIADGVGRQKFLSYLNKLTIWKQGHEQQSEVHESVLKNYIVEVREYFKSKQSNQENFQEHGNARNLNAIPDNNDPNKLTITSRGSNGETVVYYEAGKGVRIEGLDGILFTDIHEGIRVANLTNKIRHEQAGKCDVKEPFSFKGTVAGKANPGLYVNNSYMDDRILKDSTVASEFPTLYKNKDAYTNYLNKMKNSNNASLWMH